MPGDLAVSLALIHQVSVQTSSTFMSRRNPAWVGRKGTAASRSRFFDSSAPDTGSFKALRSFSQLVSSLAALQLLSNFAASQLLSSFAAHLVGPPEAQPVNFCTAESPCPRNFAQ